MNQFKRMPCQTGTGAIVAMCVSGCGKSSVAKQLAQDLGWHFLEGYTLHPEGNIAKMRGGLPLTDDDRFPWLDKIADELTSIIDEGKNVVVSRSALKRIYHQRLRNQLGPKLKFIFLSVSFEALRDRTNNRQDHVMPTSLLQSQLDTLEAPLDEVDINEINGELGPRAIVDQIRSLIKSRRTPSEDRDHE